MKTSEEITIMRINWLALFVVLIVAFALYSPTLLLFYYETVEEPNNVIIIGLIFSMCVGWFIICAFLAEIADNLGGIFHFYTVKGRRKR